MIFADIPLPPPPAYIVVQLQIRPGAIGSPGAGPTPAPSPTIGGGRSPAQRPTPAPPSNAPTLGTVPYTGLVTTPSASPVTPTFGMPSVPPVVRLTPPVAAPVATPLITGTAVSVPAATPTFSGALQGGQLIDGPTPKLEDEKKPAPRVPGIGPGSNPQTGLTDPVQKLEDVLAAPTTVRRNPRPGGEGDPAPVSAGSNVKPAATTLQGVENGLPKKNPAITTEVDLMGKEDEGKKPVVQGIGKPQDQLTDGIKPITPLPDFEPKLPRPTPQLPEQPPKPPPPTAAPPQTSPPAVIKPPVEAPPKTYDNTGRVNGKAPEPEVPRPSVSGGGGCTTGTQCPEAR